jgi:hypothetical protein
MEFNSAFKGLNNKIFWLIYTKAMCSCVKQEDTEEMQEGLRTQYI